MSHVPPTSHTTSAAPPAGGNMLAWQGWRVSLPAEWNPVRLEGDWDNGSAIVADLHGARLAMRWRAAARRPIDHARAVTAAMESEIGKLAAAEARELALSGFERSMLYIEPRPPGRDVWTAWSPVSRRLVQAVYQVRRREHLLATLILRHLRDTAPTEPVPWAVFDLSCIAPAGMRLYRQMLNAGDLSLWFVGPPGRLGVRQIALAGVALRRKPLEGWLADERRRLGRHFRPGGDSAPAEMDAGGRTLAGVSQVLLRRRRFFWAAGVPRTLHCFAAHDPLRDRLLIVHAGDMGLVRRVLPTIGRAACGQAAGSDDASR